MPLSCVPNTMEIEATYSHTKIEIRATSRIYCVKYSHLDYKLKSFWWTCCLWTVFKDFSCHESSQNHLRCLHLDAVKWQRLLWHRANDDIREAQGRRRRSGVRPKGHMVSSGVASACNPDTRSQTFTWMGSNASVCVCVWGMTASWQHVCRVSWDPGTCWWRNQVGSPPAVASCPATPGFVLTGLSLWPEVAPICFPPDFSKSLLPQR